MSLHPQTLEPAPEDTARVARAIFPEGNLVMRVRDELAGLYTDHDFSDLFPVRGQPAACPWRLAVVILLQFLEGLTDRQAAEAVRTRIDWKYSLGLRLTDPGFHFTVLTGFRTRLVEGAAGQRLLTVLLERLRARGLLTARGRQRTDSTCAASRGTGIPAAGGKNSKGGSWVTQVTWTRKGEGTRASWERGNQPKAWRLKSTARPATYGEGSTA